MSGRTNDIVNLIEYQFELISILIRIACIGEWRVSWICARARVCVCVNLFVCIVSACVLVPLQRLRVHFVAYNLLRSNWFFVCVLIEFG